MSRTLGYPAQSRISADSEMRLIIQLVQIGAVSILLTVVTPCLWLIGTITLETSDQLPFLVCHQISTEKLCWYELDWILYCYKMDLLQNRVLKNQPKEKVSKN